MGRLTKEELLTKDKLAIERVDLVEEGNYVLVREMTAHERNIFEKSVLVEVVDEKGNVTYKQTMDDFRAKLAINVLCDEEGNNLFEDPGDYEKLSKMTSASNMERIARKALDLNKISEGATEAIAKNSDPGQSDDSSSVSAGS